MRKNIQRLNDIRILEHSCKLLGIEHDIGFKLISEAGEVGFGTEVHKTINTDYIYNENSTEVRFCQIKSIAIIASFCTELGLKELLYQKNIDVKKIHFLNELFDVLDSDTKGVIVNYVKYQLKISTDEFYDKLSENKNGFVEFRYTHELNSGEQRNINFDFLNSFMGAIKKQIKW